ncbi:MAG: hypothetical protein NTW87_26245 [Planctomycetota bacterium]|nr:hypothetical protein [Planctomycetota bacterium]
MKGARRYFGLADGPARSTLDQRSGEQTHAEPSPDTRADAPHGLRRLLGWLLGSRDPRDTQR